MKRVTITCLALAAASLAACFGAGPHFITIDSGAPASRMLESFRELSGLELVIASNVKIAAHTPVIVEVNRSKLAQKTEVVTLIERALLDQAGIIITRLSDERASVTYNDALPARPGDVPLAGRIFRYKLEIAP